MRPRILFHSSPLVLSLLTVVVLGCGGAPDADLGQQEDPFATSLSGEGVHEDVTADGLDFLRSEVVLQLQASNVGTDIQFFLDSRYHFDDCNFSNASAAVADEQASAVSHLDPAGDPLLSDIAALNAFARSLHAVQDFYAHSNWVELGAAGLVDASLDAWPTLEPYSTLEPSGVIVVQGEPPAGTALYRKQGAPYPDNAVVQVRTKGRAGLGLISGSVDYEPGDACPAQVEMTHDELNKDRSTTPGRLAQHQAAKDLATEQTRHEWCRLLTLTRNAWGDAGDRRLFAWVEDEARASACGDPADLSVSIASASPEAPVAGATVSIELAFSNAGPATTYGTNVEISLGAGLSASAASSSAADCSLTTPNSISCYAGVVANGGSGSVTISAVANAEGTRSIDASISAHVTDSNAANDAASLTLGSTVLAPR